MAIITIGGNLGAGKTTLATPLAQRLGYAEWYVGGIFRQMAAERGVSIETFYAAIKDDPTIDRAVDERQMKLMRERDNVIVQGRIAWYFAKQSPFKVLNIFLAVEPLIGARRVAERPEYVGKSLEFVTVATRERTLVERERYRTLYGIEDYFDPAHYDVILDTSHLTADEVLTIALQNISERI